MKIPLFMRYSLVLGLYPLFYLTWVNGIRKTWIENDVKDIHPQILFSQECRFTRQSSPFDYKKEMDQCLVVKGRNDIRNQIQSNIQKSKKQKNETL